MTSQKSSKNKQLSSSAKKAKDERYLPRWEVDNRIIYKLETDPETCEARSKDLSCAGVCLLTPKTLPLRQKVKMKIYLTQRTSVDVQGHIVWNKPFQNENLAGVLFYNTSPKIQELILKHAFEIRKDDLVKHIFEGWSDSSGKDKKK